MPYPNSNMFSDIMGTTSPGFSSSPSYSPPSLVGAGPAMPPMSMNPFKPAAEAGKSRKTVVIVLVVVAVLLIAFMLWRARSRLSPLAAAAAAKLRGSGSTATSSSSIDAVKAENFQRDIEQLSDPETKADMKEWFAFWKVAKRPVIKDMLTQVLTVNTQPPPPKQPIVIPTPTVALPEISVGEVDPNFTAA